MKRVSHVVVVVVLALLAVACGGSPPPSDKGASVDALFKTYTKHIEDQDWDGLATLFDDPFTLELRSPFWDDDLAERLLDDDDLFDDWAEEEADDLLDELKWYADSPLDDIQITVDLERGTHDYWSTYATEISDREAAAKVLPFLLFFGEFSPPPPHISDDWVIEYSNVKLLPDVTTGSGDTREIVAVFRFDISAHDLDDPTDKDGLENMMWMNTFTLTRDASGWKITKLVINPPSWF